MGKHQRSNQNQNPNSKIPAHPKSNKQERIIDLFFELISKFMEANKSKNPILLMLTSILPNPQTLKLMLYITPNDTEQTKKSKIDFCNDIDKLMQMLKQITDDYYADTTTNGNN